MMLRSIVKFSVGIAAIVMVCSSVSARSLSDLDAVHEAAIQRTLIMRVAKSHIQLASGVAQPNVRRTLLASIEQCDQVLEDLETNSPNSVLNHRLLTLKQQWKGFRELALLEPSRHTVEALLDDSADLLYQTDSLVRQWRLRLPQQRGLFNELALQQSMLSERIGLYYAAHYYGVDEPWVLEELNLSINEYEKGMAQLRAASAGNDEQKTLELLQNQWNYAKLGLQKFNQGNYVPVVISVAMESMYAQSNQLGEQFRDADRIAMSEGRLNVGLAANMSAD